MLGNEVGNNHEVTNRILEFSQSIDDYKNFNLTQVKFIVLSFEVSLPIAVEFKKDFFILRIENIYLVFRKTKGHLLVINCKNVRKLFKIYKIT